MSILNELNSCYYLRSKIFYHPLSHLIVPIPDGLSVILCKDKSEIEPLLKMKNIDDPENFEVIRVGSIYDFMLEVAEMGYMGFWEYTTRPILFGNYVSEIDIDLPNFLFTFDGKFIGSSGEIDKPNNYTIWKNFYRTDKILRRYKLEGNPFDLPLYALAINKQPNEDILSDYLLMVGDNKIRGSYSALDGYLPLFSSIRDANRFQQSLDTDFQQNTSITEIEDINKLLENPYYLSGIDIVVNPNRERISQGYFTQENHTLYFKTVLGTYAFQESELVPIDYDIYSSDTIDSSNCINPSKRNLKTTVKYPLKRILGSTKSSINKKEIKKIINNYFENDLSNLSDCNSFYENYSKFFSEEINQDSYLLFAFDKITGDYLTNHESLVQLIVFDDFISFLQFFYYSVIPNDYFLRLDGYHLCSSPKSKKGSKNKQQEISILEDHQSAIKELFEDVLLRGYKVEHSELIKSYINRHSESVEIELCGYLSDIAIYDSEFIETVIETDNEEDLDPKIEKLAKTVNRVQCRSQQEIVLDPAIQNQLMRCLGYKYENLSIESKCILESAISEFTTIENRLNHDYSGISMKLCKVFEREVILLVFAPFRKNIKSDFNKNDLKSFLKKYDDDDDNDITMTKLLRYLLVKDKLELGPIRYIFSVLRNPDNSDLIIIKFRDFLTREFANSEYLLSQEFDDTLLRISEKYRNGGVHEKIIEYAVCKEAFEYLINSENCQLGKLIDIKYHS